MGGPGQCDQGMGAAEQAKIRLWTTLKLDGGIDRKQTTEQGEIT